MGILSLDRRIDAEVLDARGGLVIQSGPSRLQAVLRDVPELFVEGAHLAVVLQVGSDRIEALCRVVGDDVIACTPGSHVSLEVLRASPAGISSIEAFDLVPFTPPERATPPMGSPMTSLPPQAAFADDPVEDDEPTGVVGTLREMPVSEIVQSLAQANKDALVEVKPKGSEAGVIGIERGRVVYAHTDTRFGEAAFFELLRSTRGAFRIKYGRNAGARNIERETTFLLLEGARVLDEELAHVAHHDNVLHEPPHQKIHAQVPAQVHAELQAEMAAALGLEGGLGFEGGHIHAVTSGLFSRFFDEAGVQTPAPLPQETQRFQSLQVVADMSELDDDLDRVDTDRTTRERKRPAGSQLSDTPV